MKGIYTQRNTNPLCPKYKYPGNEELKGYYENNPYNNFNPSFNSTLSRSKSMNNNLKTTEEKKRIQIIIKKVIRKFWIGI